MLLLFVNEICIVCVDDLWLSFLYGIDVVGLYFIWKFDEFVV